MYERTRLNEPAEKFRNNPPRNGDRIARRKVRPPRARWFALRIAVVLLIMLDTLRRMTEGIRPFDWVMLAVEVLVLVFVGGESITSFLHRRKVEKGKQALRGFINRGQALLNTLPAGSADWPQWEQSALGLIEEVKKYLGKRSPDALEAFLAETDWEHADRIRRFHPVLDAKLLSQELSKRVANLHSIVLSADVYF